MINSINLIDLLRLSYLYYLFSLYKEKSRVQIIEFKINSAGNPSILYISYLNSYFPGIPFFYFAIIIYFIIITLNYVWKINNYLYFGIFREFLSANGSWLCNIMNPNIEQRRTKALLLHYFLVNFLNILKLIP